MEIEATIVGTGVFRMIIIVLIVNRILFLIVDINFLVLIRRRYYII